MPEALPPKKDVARALLLRGNVFVHLDPRRPGVQVPAWLSQQPQLVLQIGLDMPVPIVDLRVDDDGVSGTLSFQRSPFCCDVRWDAVFALVGDDGRGMVWPEDIPPEIASEVAREIDRAESGLQSDAPRKKLRAVARQGGGAAADTPSSPPQGSTGKLLRIPPYLRVVK